MSPCITPCKMDNIRYEQWWDCIHWENGICGSFKINTFSFIAFHSAVRHSKVRRRNGISCMKIIAIFAMVRVPDTKCAATAGNIGDSQSVHSTERHYVETKRVFIAVIISAMISVIGSFISTPFYVIERLLDHKSFSHSSVCMVGANLSLSI